jgi:V-type H+-transporting ATPase proteolipid subunit
VLSCIGAAYGTAQAGLGLCRAGTRDHNMIIKGIIPVAMAGVRGIYGLVLAIIIMSGIHPDKDYTQYNGFMHLGAGLCCGAAQFASGIAVGVVGESGTQAVVRQMKLFAPVVLILIFTEVGLQLRTRRGERGLLLFCVPSLGPPPPSRPPFLYFPSSTRTPSPRSGTLSLHPPTCVRARAVSQPSKRAFCRLFLKSRVPSRRPGPSRAALALYGLIVGMILAQSGQRRIVDA